ncbi:hypothetical protein [Stenomitos frigidus]|uniref:Uncharacterized protein n=1 Tax=Stenomitos frigidus ULC18 TaxID=2107698 RepID=A0A2T1E853_9CYAN|nr:hypothetical protein [Stenomitos frigidus]PSB28911.1 hypothetical protein C7B82_12430 [Stenomitos frigidus ULC18]
MQFQQQFAIDSQRIRILRNGISRAFHSDSSRSLMLTSQKQYPPVLAYTSTPFRGLGILLELFPAIRRAVSGAILKVFSSMNVSSSLVT